MATRSTAASLFVSLRPDQWTKNLIVFAALIFAVKLLDPAALANASAAFLIFCALSGAVYLINDVSDREQDRQHPLKRMRPIASGDLSPGTAMIAAVVLSVVALAASFALRPAFGVAAAAYLALFVVYTRSLKHIVVLDVMTIAIGFVLRAVAGGPVINVHDQQLAAGLHDARGVVPRPRRSGVTKSRCSPTGPRDIAAFWRSTTRTCSIR